MAAAASAFEAFAEEAEDKDPIIKKECAAAEMPAEAALTPAASEAPAAAAAVAAAPALPAALVLVQRPMTGGSTGARTLTMILEQPGAK